MQIISDDYKKLNAQLHQENRFYGAIGFRHTDKILALVKTYKTKDILDYGCGKSSLARNLPFDIKEYDPAIKKYFISPQPADIVVCTDVLEHIEPEFIDNVIANLRRLTKLVGFFTVSIDKATKTLPDGRNAHLIIEEPIWWLNKIYHHFDVLNFVRQQCEIILLVKPKWG